MEWAAAGDRLRSPIFQPLRGAIERLPRERWPTHDDLTAAARGIVTSSGRPLAFVAPRERSIVTVLRNPAERERRHYELHIAETGEVETRPGNWHDLFNALVWLAFPAAKGAVNAQHAAILRERGEAEARRRGPERDALTLFDEGGVAVATSSADVPRRVRDFEWKALFWTERAALEASTRFFAFGHALYEKALDPHPGVVAKTVFVEVDATFLALGAAAQGAEVDRRLAAHFADRPRFASPREMPPLPVFGIPGWNPGTDRESFYDDASYFRRKPGSDHN